MSQYSAVENLSIKTSTAAMTSGNPSGSQRYPKDIFPEFQVLEELLSINKPRMWLRTFNAVSQKKKKIPFL